MNLSIPQPSSGESYRFTEIGQDDWDVFIDAWEEGFQRRLSQEVYRWIFNGHNRMFAALSGTNIAAGYCLYPMDAVIDGEVTQVLLCNNVFVLPEHQGKFLFSRLGRYALQIASDNGYPLSYGIPNLNALAGHRRVGWAAQRVEFLERPRQIGTKPASVHWSHSLPREVLPALEECSRRSAAKRRFSILKTQDFICWRYLSKPGVQSLFATVWRERSVGAYAVCKYFPEKKCLHIIDIDGDDLEAIEEIVAAVDSVDLPFDKVNLWSSTVHRPIFEHSGFSLSPEANMLILIRPLGLKGAVIEDGLNLVLADNDVY